MQEIIEINNNNLVLEFSRTAPSFLKKWEDFLNYLCDDREYQKEAIIHAITFLYQYNSIEELFKENYSNNSEIKKLYKNESDFLNTIQLNKHSLSANIDIATAGGKSYVMYGISQIMLSERLVDKVLLLCPSTTIETGLKEKFKNLTSDENLRNLIPSGSIMSPSIIDGNSDFENNSICIENIHSAYKGTNSSLTDELFKKEGQNILILNDESHHIYNKIDSSEKDENFSKAIKQWKSILINTDYNFKYILGFTGTPYIGNDYFNDVIYKYSLKKAIEDKNVKQIEYLSDDETNVKTNNENHNFEIYYQIHQDNIKKYSGIKPLTIMITSNVAEAEKLKDTLISQLTRIENKDTNEVEKKVLCITNKSNIKDKLLLNDVDNKQNPIEWIISVSMLNEGWDSKNVLQIIPMEERAFQSKLLISQVIGRGLRKIPGINASLQKVKVLNHPSWNKKIANLVQEVLEIETKITSSVVNESNDRYKYNFDLHRIIFTKKRSLKQANNEDNQFDLEKKLNEGIKLVYEKIEKEKNIVFNNTNGETTEMTVTLKNSFTTVDDLTNKIYNSFVASNNEADILNKRKVNLENLNESKIKHFIRQSLNTINEKDIITSLNEQRLLNIFSNIIKNHTKTIGLDTNANDVKVINTLSMNKYSVGLSNFKQNSTVFYDESFKKYKDLNENLTTILEETLFNEDSTYPKKSSKSFSHEFFKTPLDIIIASSKPERQFINSLIDNAELIDKWIKSRDIGFYEIEYSLNKQPKIFNPDFFIEKTFNGIVYKIVVEVKEDNDLTVENKRKNESATFYFNTLNNILKEKNEKTNYIFTFLSPSNFDDFFTAINNGDLFKNKFNSELSIKLEELKLEQ